MYVCCSRCPMDGMVTGSKDVVMCRWVQIEGLWVCPMCREPFRG